MRKVSKVVRRSGVILVLCTVLSSQAALAAPRGDGDGGFRGAFTRVKQAIGRVVKTLEDCRLGFPPG